MSAASPLSRADRTARAIAWYTGTLGLAITPIHYPTTLATPTTEGECSCGRAYALDEHGVIDKSDDTGTRCNSPGKHPRFGGFASDPAMRAWTPEDAERLWRTDPAYNVGILTGRDSGVLVIDVDWRHGGTKSVNELAEALEELKVKEFPGAFTFADTFSYTTSATSSDAGSHHLFRMDIDDLAPWSLLRRVGENALPGVELKFKRGMVVAAPSLHASGSQYELRADQKPVMKLEIENVQALAQAVLEVKSRTGGVKTLGSAVPSYKALYGPSHAASTGLTWADAPDTAKDAPHMDGYWSRQLEYLWITGTPARTFGPGEHHESLKALFGAAVRLTAPSEYAAPKLLETMNAQRDWIPAFWYGICADIDLAVTRPKPWYESDPENFTGLVRSLVYNEVSRYNWTQTRQL